MDGFVPSNVPAGKEYLLEGPKPTTTPAAVAGGDDLLASLVASIKHNESGGNTKAVSPQGAMGAMQIMPNTFKQYALPGETFENEAHREAAAVRKIQDDFKFYGGDPAKTAAAYIGGRGAVRSDGTIRDDVKDALGTTPRAYAQKVLSRLGQPPSSPQAPAATPEAPQPPPAWAEVTQNPQFAALPHADKERMRDKYWEEVVLPRVPLGQAAEYRAAFDADTKPGKLDSAIGKMSDTLEAVKKGVRGAFSLSGETLDQLERSYRSMKQGAAVAGADITKNVQAVMDRVDRGETVAEADDPLGYQHMNPEQRQQARADAARAVPALLGSLAREQKKQETLYRNPAAHDSIKAANEGRWADAWKAFASDPGGAIKDLSVSNLAQTVPMAVGGTAGALVKGVPGLMIGLGTGSFPVDYAMSLVEYLNDAGVDIGDAEAVHRKLSEPGFMKEMESYAAAHAGVVAMVDAATGKLLRPLRSGAANVVRNVGVGARNLGVEIVGEMVGEAGGQQAGRGDVKWGDVIAEGLAAGPQAIATTTAATIAHAGTKVAPRETTAPASGAPPAQRETGPVNADEVLGTPEAAPVAPAASGRSADAGPLNVDDLLGPADAPSASEEAAAAPATTEAPAVATIAPVDEAAHAAASSPKNDLADPSPEQINAGNYVHGHPKVGPFSISIENPEGSVRRSKPDAPVKWERTMTAHYGYFKGAPARAPDKEHVDAFVKPGTAENHAGPAFVIDQNHEDGKFDEPKVMVGYASREEAVRSYLSNYQDGWASRVRGVTDLTTEQLQERLHDKKAFLKPQPDATPLAESKTAPSQEDAGPARAAHADARLENETHRAELQRMAHDAGWSEIGGRVIRDPTTNQVTGRTRWIPNAAWWPGRPDGLNRGQLREAVRKALAREKLSPKELRTIQYMLDQADQEHAAMEEADQPAEEFTAVELNQSGIDDLHAAQLERAIELADAAVGAAPDNWSTMTDGEKDAYLDSQFGEDSRTKQSAAAGAQGRAEAHAAEAGPAVSAEGPAPPVARQPTPKYTPPKGGVSYSGFVPLSTITVKIKAIEAETGRAITMEEKADTALKDVDEQISKARMLLACLKS